MTVTDVAGRISQIQAQLALLAPTRPAPSTATAFARTLGAAATTESTSYAETPAVSATGPTGADVVAEAKKYLGLPYVWGGTDPEKGMDCSGLVQVVYRNLGIELPRVSYQQAAAGRPVASLAEAQPGDLVAWDNSSRNNGVDHIAIYAGDGMIIEAPRTGLDIRLISIEESGHGQPDVIRRVLPDQSVAPAAPVSGASRVPESTPFARLFNDAGSQYGVPPALLAAVAKQESGYQPGVVSHAGAQGLMQLMPATARGLGVADPFDPAQAVDGAARLLRDLLDRFGTTPLALAAYNAGPGAVLRYDGIPPYPETQNYVRSVMAMLGGQS